MVADDTGDTWLWSNVSCCCPCTRRNDARDPMPFMVTYSGVTYLHVLRCHLPTRTLVSLIFTYSGVTYLHTLVPIIFTRSSVTLVSLIVTCSGAIYVHVLWSHCGVTYLITVVPSTAVLTVFLFYFSSLQSKIAPACSGEPICTPSCLSVLPPMLPLKQFQC